MTAPSITIEQADGDDVEHVITVLEANGLPTEDVQAKPECFFLGYSDGERIGIGGLELYGSNGLLRSVVVVESYRERGYGTALCTSLEEYARRNGVGTLYLLTTTAPAFFRQRRYEEVARKDVPSSIQQTTEFADLCPNSATCMRKTLVD